MKSLTPFLREVLIDLGTWCHTSTISDLKTITERSEHEGISFLTISLPKFGKDFERSLDQGFVGSDHFAGFKRSGGLPRFLSGFLCQVFDRHTGQLLHDPSIEAIRAVRQLTLMWAKINLKCTPAREKAAIAKYVECEKDVQANLAALETDRLERYSRLGSMLWASVFQRVDESVYYGEITPKHGPGATAERRRGNAKWRQDEWTSRLEQVFPHGEYLASSWRYFQDLSHVRILEPGTERPVRVITVPKTLATPRIIAIEPTCMQYMQQGVLGAIEQALEQDDFCRGLVGWSSQVPNQHLAWQGSSNGTLATLDLSEASDRVANEHVRVLLRNHRYLSAAVDSTRSRKARVPGHGVMPLAKFASMGSALCFPFEAMVFATIIFTGIERQLSRPLTRKDLKSFAGKVRVYGDDIIVPVDYVSSVIEELEAFGLRVNSNKSFWTGKFRESCGKEFYDGHDVSIVRIREEFPTSRKSASEIVSTVSLRNQLYWVGLWRSARYLDDRLERLIPFPRVSENSQILGRHSALGPEISEKLCPNLHVPLVKGIKVRSKIPASQLDDYGALLKCLIRLEKRNPSLARDDYTPSPSGRSSWSDLFEMPIEAVSHLKHSGRPRSVDIKIGLLPSC